MGPIKCDVICISKQIFEIIIWTGEIRNALFFVACGLPGEFIFQTCRWSAVSLRQNPIWIGWSTEVPSLLSPIIGSLELSSFSIWVLKGFKKKFKMLNIS